MGLNAYYAFYPLLLNEVFDFSSQEIGFITVVLTTFMILTSVFFVSQIKNSIGIVHGTQLGLMASTYWPAVITCIDSIVKAALII